MGFITQYICMAGPPEIPSAAIGKASIWGCFIPGPGDTAYKVPNNVELLVSNNLSPCLTWDQKLDPSHEPTGPVVFGDPPMHVCYVQHIGTYHDDMGNVVATKGPRIGQVRSEGGVWVCRYEFYYGEYMKTFVNQMGEDTRVLDLAP
jgi:hypothetical protein